MPQLHAEQIRDHAQRPVLARGERRAQQLPGIRRVVKAADRAVGAVVPGHTVWLARDDDAVKRILRRIEYGPGALHDERLFRMLPVRRAQRRLSLQHRRLLVHFNPLAEVLRTTRNLGFAGREQKGDTRHKPGRFGQFVAHRITLLALEGCFASNITGAIDLFNTANLIARRLGREPPFAWQVLSLDGRPVRASSGYRITADNALENGQPARLGMIPAFGSPQPEQLMGAVKHHAALLPWLIRQYQSGATLAASCSGTFLLAESGLLEGKPATTSWWLADAFRKRYPKVNLDLACMLTDSGR